jgi:PAS domain S-box-containing protein
MFKRPDIPIRIPLSSKAREDKSAAVLLISNLLFVSGTAIMMLLDILRLFNNSYFLFEVSLLGISIPSLYFLIKGSKQTAVNFINLLPVPIYFLMVSPLWAIIPPQYSYFLHASVLISGLIFLLVFANELIQIIIFSLVSLISIGYHFYSTNILSKFFKIFWIPEDFLINPALLFLISIAIVILLFIFFNGKLSRQEKKIKERESILQNSFNQISLGIIRIRVMRDEMGEKSGLSIEQINSAFEIYFNIRNSEVSGEPPRYLFDKIFRDEVDWQDIFFNKNKVQHEIFIPHCGQWYKIIVLHPDKDHLIGIFDNITDSRNALKELDNSRHRYQLLLETIPDIFFVIDKEGTFVDYVAKEEDGFTFSAKEIIGSTIFEVGYSKKMMNQVNKSIQTVIKLDSIETIEYVLEIKGKGSCFFEMRMVKLSDSSVMAISRDITKQKIAQQKIEEAKKKAEEADQLKSAFLQNISHEIRTPLNVIMGFSDVLIADDEIDESERKNYLQLIIRNGQILLHVFNDTIKLSRIQSGLVKVEKNFIYLNNIISDLHTQFLNEKKQLGKSNLKLTVIRGNENAKFSVYMDGQKVRDILESLLDNAIKFTKEGEIHFGYRLMGSVVEFFVKDTGIGIPEDKFDEIFQRFYQLDSSMTREYGGTGIGLSLATDFARILGTKIEVQSVQGKGSRFSFKIPMEAAEGHLRIVRNEFQDV